MPESSAEFTVDEPLARRLISRFFVPRTLRPLAEGWDNAVWLADERWAFWLPRRQIAIPGVRREIAVLGELAPQLPLPIPVPRFVGHAPWPYFGAELIAGEEPLGLTDDERRAVARPLGEFLRALHSASVSAELPDDPMGRADMAIRVPRTADALAAIGVEPPRGLLDAASRLPRPDAMCVTHGDLHFRHVLVDGGAVAGVIDWGDVCRGDPSIDLVLYWAVLPPDARPAFLAAYGPVSEERLLRARVLAFNLGAVIAHHATVERLDAVRDEALATLARAAS